MLQLKDTDWQIGESVNTLVVQRAGCGTSIQLLRTENRFDGNAAAEKPL